MQNDFLWTVSLQRIPYRSVVGISIPYYVPTLTVLPLQQFDDPFLFLDRMTRSRNIYDELMNEIIRISEKDTDRSKHSNSVFDLDIGHMSRFL